MTITSETVDALGPRPKFGTGGIHRPGLSSVHNPGSPLLAELLAEIGEYREVLDALRVLDPIDPPDGASATSNAAFVLADELEAAALSGDLDAEGIPTRAHYLLSAIQTRVLVGDALNAARVSLASRLGDVVHAHADSMLAALNDRLRDVTTGCRALAKTGPVERLLDGGSAFDDGRSEEFETFRELAARYADIRDAQSRLVRSIRPRGQSSSRNVDEAEIFADTLSVMKHWAAWKEHGHVVQRKVGGKVQVTAPWPGSTRKNLTDGTASKPEFLAWAVDSGAQLWVPTGAQLDAARERLQHELDAPTDDGGDLVHPSLRSAPVKAGA